MQQSIYSRKSKVEEKSNLKNAFVFGFLTIAAIAFFAFFGFGLLAKFAVFLGDLKKSSQPVESTDTTPPIAPRFDTIPKSTNQSKLEFSGNTEPGATVVFTFNGETIDILANNNGDFTTAVTLNEGENEIMSYSKDTAGNKSATTDTFVITYDKTAPNLDITKPQDQATFYGSKERQLLIQGKTDEKTRVSVNGRHVVVESNGSFTFLTTLSEGENKFTIKAEDEASNITEKTLTVTYSP